MRQSRSDSRSVGIRSEDIILPDTENPTQLCGSTISRNVWVRRKVGKDRVRIFIVWSNEIEMSWCLSTQGSAEYILPVTLCTSLTPVSLYNGCGWFTIYLESVIERDWRCPWRPYSSEWGNTLRCRDWASLEAVIEWHWRCTWRLSSCIFGGCN
jgi:hypothetical protein